MGASFLEVVSIMRESKNVGPKEMETKSVATLRMFGTRIVILTSLVAVLDYEQPQIVTRLNIHLRSS